MLLCGLNRNFKFKFNSLKISHGRVRSGLEARAMVIAKFRSRLNFIWALFSWWKFQNIFMQNRKIVLFKQLRKGVKHVAFNLTWQSTRTTTRKYGKVCNFFTVFASYHQTTEYTTAFFTRK